MTTMVTSCIVHDRKYLSKFHGAINLLRRNNEFSVSILQKLPKLCCSCHMQTGESSIDLDQLSKICHQIKLSEETQPAISCPVKPIPYVILRYSATLTPIQRMYKAGRFVGRGGVHLQLLERTFNVRLNISNQKSKKECFRRNLTGIQSVNHINDDLWVFITMTDENNDDNNVNKVKKALEDQWEKIDVHTKKRQPRNKQHFKMVTDTSMDLDGDTRWIPVKHKRNAKNQRTQKQCAEQEEVAPQPQVRPLSMPKEIKKTQKIKR